MGKNGKREIKRIVVDTDIIIDHLRQTGSKTPLAYLVKDKNIKLFMAAVSLTELYIGKSAARMQQEKELKQAIAKIQLILADKRISKEAGILMRNYRFLRLADSLVAATAIVKKAQLYTFNIKHFQSIKGISLYQAKGVEIE
jgi:predicted nucleic acid-binding protein